MRADLNKQLCEHERYDSSESFRRVRHAKKFQGDHGADPELMVSRESMTKRGRTKSFGENLNPLFGAVRKAVGRRWDSFYSDLCQTFDKRSVINQHILQHLMRYVEKDNIFIEDGELYVRQWHAKYKLRESNVEYFVDPRDGILRRNKYYKSYNRAYKERAAKDKAEKAKLVKIIDSKNILRFDEEKKIWYHYTVDYAPIAQAMLNPTSETRTYTVRHGGQVIEKTWEELSGSEKKHYGEQVYNPAQVVYDVYLEKRVVFDGSHLLEHYATPGKVYTPYNTVKHDFNLPANAYLKSKQTASHKTMKKAGIIE